MLASRACLAVLLLVSGPLACATNRSGSAGEVWHVAGQIQFDVYESPVCGSAGPSPIGQCSREVYTGVLQGNGDTAIQSMVPIDPAGVVFISENEMLHLPDGDIETKVNAVFNGGSPDLEFVSMHTIVGGSGRYAGATGYFRLTGRGGEVDPEAKYDGRIRLGP